MARFVEAADRDAVFRVIEDARVEAIGGSDADHLGEAARVGGVECTKIVHFRMIAESFAPAETAGRLVPVANAELVLVASHGVALREDGQCKGKD